MPYIGYIDFSTAVGDGSTRLSSDNGTFFIDHSTVETYSNILIDVPAIVAIKEFTVNKAQFDIVAARYDINYFFEDNVTRITVSVSTTDGEELSGGFNDYLGDIELQMVKIA